MIFFSMFKTSYMYILYWVISFHSHSALAKTEHKLSQELLSTTLCHTEDSFRWYVQEWDAALVKMELHMSEHVSVRNLELSG